MKTLRRIAPRVIVLNAVAAILIVAGCGTQRVRISKILEDPNAYMDETVIIAGEVVRAKSIPLFIAEPGFYQVDDGTGAIWVITQGNVPREGTEIGVKGVVTSPLRFMGERVGAVVREKERKTR